MTIFGLKFIIMRKDDEMIPIDLHLNYFKQYLDANSRCILSAKFGNGKSYFINQFIEKYSDEYLFVPIYPVNYQVMDNKDIFELIKRDILIRLLSSGLVDIETIDFNPSFLCYFYFINNATDIFTDILSIIPNVNLCGVDINIGNVIKKVKGIKNKYDKWKQNVTKTQKQSADDYINHFTNLKGSIYEFDTISQLICDIIKEYKQNYPEKKVVLIIEDLDRIDPAHIFRILNVFSAHFDRYNVSTLPPDSIGDDNKFCFDKIISVCDIDNIRNIYHHVYGEKTDFVGYISKFSNSKAFRYSLQDYLKDYIINKLLDNELQEYKIVSSYLAEQIIGSMDKANSPESNLRIIKERIIRAMSLIKRSEIQLEPPLNDYYVTTDSVFIYFLALLRCFDIDYSSIIHVSDVNREITLMVGKYWPLVRRFNKNIFFEIKNNIIDVSYLVSQYGGYSQWEGGYSFHFRLKDNELIDFNMKNFNVEHSPLAPKLYGCIDDIILYLTKETII
jgi:hypothetical protein